MRYAASLKSAGYAATIPLRLSRDVPAKFLRESKKKNTSSIFLKIKKINSLENIRFFGKSVNLKINPKIPILKGMDRVVGWGKRKLKIFLSFYLTQNFFFSNNFTLRYKFINIFKPTRIAACKLVKYRELLLSKLYNYHAMILNKLKKRLFLKFFSLRNISFYILKQITSQWGSGFKRFPQLADFINVVNISLFFTKAEFLCEAVIVNIVKNKRTWLNLLRQTNRLLQYFYPIFCARPVNYSVRIGIFGKLGGQRKRKFKTLFLTAGSGNPRQRFSVPLDYFFKGF